MPWKLEMMSMMKKGQWFINERLLAIYRTLCQWKTRACIQEADSTMSLELPRQLWKLWVSCSIWRMTVWSRFTLTNSFTRRRIGRCSRSSFKLSHTWQRSQYVTACDTICYCINRIMHWILADPNVMHYEIFDCSANFVSWTKTMKEVFKKLLLSRMWRNCIVVLPTGSVQFSERRGTRRLEKTFIPILGIVRHERLLLQLCPLCSRFLSTPFVLMMIPTFSFRTIVLSCERVMSSSIPSSLIIEKKWTAHVTTSGTSSASSSIPFLLSVLLNIKQFCVLPKLRRLFMISGSRNVIGYAGWYLTYPQARYRASKCGDWSVLLQRLRTRYAWPPRWPLRSNFNASWISIPRPCRNPTNAFRKKEFACARTDAHERFVQYGSIIQRKV